MFHMDVLCWCCCINDIAVLKVNGQITNHTHLEWGNSRNSIPGDICYVLGDPQGVDAISISKGVVRDNKFTYDNSIEYLSTDASIYSGNSGSPILDINGKILGIISFTIGDGNTLGAGASQFIMEYVVNKIIDNQSDYVGKILNINARPINSIFLPIIIFYTSFRRILFNFS